MGKVYTPEAVQAGNVPEEGVHQAAARLLLDRLIPYELRTDDFVAESPTPTGLNSAMVYGSTVTGLYNRRSDLDTLINFSPLRMPLARQAIRATFAEVRSVYKVSIEAQVLADGDLANPRRHGFDPLFINHVLEVNELKNPEWSYNDAAGLLRGQQIDPNNRRQVRGLAMGYASSRYRTFAKAWANYDGTPDYDVLQRMFEYPAAIGRKIIPAIREEGDVIPHISQKDTMEQIVATKLEELAPEHLSRAATMQTRLAALNKEYTEVLEATMTGKKSVHAYKQWLIKAAPEAYECAMVASAAWSDIITTNRDLPFEDYQAESYKWTMSPSDYTFDCSA
jgi:hypothetical protein